MMPLRPHGRYDSRQATRYSGASDRQLRYWDQVGLARPSIEQTGGRPGVWRIYSGVDVFWLIDLARARRLGIPLQRLRTAEEMAETIRAGNGAQNGS